MPGKALNTEAGGRVEEFATMAVVTNGRTGWAEVGVWASFALNLSWLVLVSAFFAKLRTEESHSFGVLAKVPWLARGAVGHAFIHSIVAGLAKLGFPGVSWAEGSCIALDALGGR